MDDLTAAFMAKLVSGNLQMIDESTTHRSATGGQANKINAHNFVNSKPQNISEVTVQPAQQVVQQMSTHALPAPSRSNDAVPLQRNTSKNISVKTTDIEVNESVLTHIKSIDKSLKTISITLKKLIETK